MPEPLEVFRTIVVEIDLGENRMTIPVPLTLELLQRCEETLQKCEDAGWWFFRKKKSDKSIMGACVEFCRPYLPENFNESAAQPQFFLLFFSRVKDELLASIKRSIDSANPTGT